MITEETARKQLETLHGEGSVLVKALAKEEEAEPFEEGYQRWYSRALPLMKELAPDRYAEFQRYYSRDAKAKLHWAHDHVIQDYICDHGEDYPITNREQAVRAFTIQLALLKSISDRLAWGGLDTGEQAERFMQLTCLDEARRLMGIDERAAGAFAGIVLESYLRKLAVKHKLKFRKQAPPLREYLDALHTAKVLDVPAHALGAWITEIAARSRAEGQPPSKDQVRDLIDGSRWLITNVF